MRVKRRGLMLLTMLVMSLHTMISVAMQIPVSLHKDINNMTQNSVKLTTLPANSIELIHGKGEPNYAVIWLHGLGATANDFPGIVPELGLDSSKSIRFIFPQAPNRPITINGGMSMPGWYDIKGMSIEDKQDRQGMAESQAMVDGIIADLINGGMPSNHILLAGFSQGGAVTYYAGVRSEHQLAGLLPLSTYLPFDVDTQDEQSGANVQTPIFASHGTHDPVVPLQLGQTSVTLLNELGYTVRWETYPMEHQVIMQQIKDIGQWINMIFTDA